MALGTYWKHFSATGNSAGRVEIGSANPFGTHAISGGGWIGGDSSNTSTNGQDAGETLIVAQFPVYDSNTDTTYWHVVFSVQPGSSVRTHVFANVIEES